MSVSDESVDAVMLDVFGSFERNCILWAIPPARPSRQEPQHLVDLLVAEEDLRNAQGALVDQGFLPEAGRRGRTSQNFLKYLPAGDEWVRLTVCGRLSFGSLHVLEAHDVAQLVGRRQRRGIRYDLQPDDAFWILMLNCLLEDVPIQEADLLRLKELAVEARPNGMLPLYAHRFASHWNAEAVISAARNGDGPVLTALGRRLRAEAEAKQESPRRGVTARVFERSTGFALQRGCGLTVALLAPDGAGKSAVAGSLRASLPMAVKVIYMGRARATRKGRRGSVASALLRQWSRHLTARFHRFQGRLVLFDRYTYDAMLPPRNPKRARVARRWLFAHAVPAPDLVVLLDTPADLMFRRKGEHPRDFLERRRRDYLDLKSRLPNMVVVDGAQDLDSVRRDVTRAIWSIYRSRSMSKRFNRTWSL